MAFRPDAPLAFSEYCHMPVGDIRFSMELRDIGNGEEGGERLKGFRRDRDKAVGAGNVQLQKALKTNVRAVKKTNKRNNTSEGSTKAGKNEPTLMDRLSDKDKQLLKSSNCNIKGCLVDSDNIINSVQLVGLLNTIKPNIAINILYCHFTLRKQRYSMR